MTNRTLAITLQPDWQTAPRRAGSLAQAGTYQGETLNFETPGAFFAKLSERRWTLLGALQGQGELAVRELARRVGRDVKRVHGDVQILVDLGLVERGAGATVFCPFSSVHIDMDLRAPPALAA